MKTKRRHHGSSEESVESDDSEKSSSSSESESDVSSVSDHRQKKKRKRANSSNSDSDSEEQRRAKKRKHKKKKKKHSKKKRRSESDNDSDDQLSLSEGEISIKKNRKHKHKHSKHAQSPESADVRHVEHRLHSVVKERRADSEEQRPARTYYQKEYLTISNEYDREAEVERFYRGSSKDRRAQFQENYYYEQNRPDSRYVRHDRMKEHGHGNQYQDYGQRHREFEHYKKIQRIPENNYYPKRRNEQYSRDDTKGTKYSQYADRGPPRRIENVDERDYHHRRGPPERELYKERPYSVKHEGYIEEDRPTDRSRDERRERSSRPEKQIPQQREYSRSPEERHRERRRSDIKEDRQNISRERDDRRRENCSDDRPDRNRERKSRFTQAGEDKKEYSWGKIEVKVEGSKPADKEKPNFGLSGKLTADANTVNGVVIKYTEPDDAKQPKRRWRFYPFKGDKALPILYIHRQSAFLIGRDKKVCDIPLEHPSISKQHAALQYRATPFTRPDGSTGRRVRPYVIDLDSANGTFVNNKKIDGRRYVELLERDVVKFGFSQREYVLLHENSKDEGLDDDQDVPATTDHIKREKRVKEEMAADG